MTRRKPSTVIDYKLLEDPSMAKQALEVLQKTKTELDDLADTLEILSNPRFRKNLDAGLGEARRGRGVKLSPRDFRKRIE